MRAADRTNGGMEESQSALGGRIDQWAFVGAKDAGRFERDYVPRFTVRRRES
jgi:hypothetical protein